MSGWEIPYSLYIPIYYICKWSFLLMETTELNAVFSSKPCFIAKVLNGLVGKKQKERNGIELGRKASLNWKIIRTWEHHP